MGGIFLKKKKKRLRQRRGSSRASRNMGTIFLAYGGHFLAYGGHFLALAAIHPWWGYWYCLFPLLGQWALLTRFGVLTILPSSLDLLNSVVRECCPDPATGAPPRPQPAIARILIPRSRNLEIWKSRNLEIWDPTNLKNEILQIKIRVAQNLGKV